MGDNHCLIGGWVPDETFESMRGNCEAYKEKDMELNRAKKVIAHLTEENTTLKNELLKYIIDKPKKDQLKTWNDYILYVCRDHVKRTSKDIFTMIQGMDGNEGHPWNGKSKTPENTCSATCYALFKDKLLLRTTSHPMMYYM
jgi:hypothetical protein